jgi:hypothetical protein
VDTVTEFKPWCMSLVGLIRGHKFEPRYDQRDYGDGPPKELVEKAMNQTLASSEAINSDITEIGLAYSQSAEFYIQDVCVRCGAVVPRTTLVFPLGSDGTGMPEPRLEDS